MLGRNVVTVMRRNTHTCFHVPKRNWAQVAHVICTPPRVRVSFGEKLLHGLFMVTVWLTPMAYGMAHIKIWRRQYIDQGPD